MELLTEILTFLQTGGPWAITILLGVALYKKDQECKNAYKTMNDLSLSQTKALLQLESTVKALKDILLLQIQSRNLGDNDER